MNPFKACVAPQREAYTDVAPEKTTGWENFGFCHHEANGKRCPVCRDHGPRIDKYFGTMRGPGPYLNRYWGPWAGQPW